MIIKMEVKVMYTNIKRSVNVVFLDFLIKRTNGNMKLVRNTYYINSNKFKQIVIMLMPIEIETIVKMMSVYN